MPSDTVDPPSERIGAARAAYGGNLVEAMAEGVSAAGRSPKKSSGNGQYDVVWSRGERRQVVRPLAKRLDTLNGKTIAQLWDYLFAGDEVFATLEQKLRERYP